MRRRELIAGFGGAGGLVDLIDPDGRVVERSWRDWHDISTAVPCARPALADKPAI
jgi:hypothetical protein